MSTTLAKQNKPLKQKPQPLVTEVVEEAPSTFHDSLLMRARNLRFRGIGNPFSFLAEIGLVPIKEFIYRGATIIDLAETLNLPVTTLRTWIEENGYQAEIEEASTLSAEGYIVQGERMLKAATDKFQLDKAKAMIEHGRFMASKKDKKTYGNQGGDIGGAAAVSYVFQIGGGNVQVNMPHTQPTAKSVEDIPAEPDPIVFSPLQIDRPPEHLRHVHSDYPVIAPVPEPDEGLDL